MRFRYVALALVPLFLAVPGLAQDDVADVKQVVDKMIQATIDGDADTLDGLLHKLYISYSDPDGTVLGREASIEDAKVPLPLKVEVGDYKPEVYGDLAYAVFTAKVSVPDPDMTFELQSGAVLVRQEGEWKVVADCTLLNPEFLKGIDLGADTEEAEATIDAAQESFEGFVNSLMTAGAEADMAGFLKLCDEAGTTGGPYGPEGEMIVVPMKALIDAGPGGAGPTIVPADDPQEMGVMGTTVAMLAITLDITVPEQEPVPHRSVLIARYDADAGAWKIILSMEAPIEG